MTNQIVCLRCLTAGTQTPVTLAANAYRCPACGFAAAVERLTLAELWDRPRLRVGPVWWSAEKLGEAHCMEIER